MNIVQRIEWRLYKERKKIKKFNANNYCIKLQWRVYIL